MTKNQVRICISVLVAIVVAALAIGSALLYLAPKPNNGEDVGKQLVDFATALKDATSNIKWGLK